MNYCRLILIICSSTVSGHTRRIRYIWCCWAVKKTPSRKSTRTEFNLALHCVTSVTAVSRSVSRKKRAKSQKKFSLEKCLYILRSVYSVESAKSVDIRHNHYVTWLPVNCRTRSGLQTYSNIRRNLINFELLLGTNNITDSEIDE